ncbi:MAG: calcium-binding protein, partial [Planctomycetota bacterium]
MGLLQAVQDRLAALTHATGTFLTESSTPDELSFTLDLELDRSVMLHLDLENQIPGDLIKIDGDIDVAANFNVSVKATIGVDLTASSASDAFFVRFDPAANENQVTGDVQFDQTTPLTARIGLLEATLGPSTEPEDGLDLNLNVGFDVDGGGDVGIDALTATPIDTLVAFDTSGSDFKLQIPVSAEFNGLPTGQSGSGRALFLVEDSDLFDDEFDSSGQTADPNTMADFVRLENADAFVDFRQVTSIALFNALEQVQEALVGFTDSPAFSTPIPFTGGQTIADVLPIREAFGSRIIAPAGDMTEGGEGLSFESIQDFVNLIGDATEYTAATNDEPAKVEVDLSFSHFFDVLSYPLDLGEALGDLNEFGLSASSQIDVGAILDVGLKLGISLQRPGADFTFNDMTPLSALNRGMGIMPVVGSSDVRITLRDGTSRDINFDGLTTIGALKTALKMPFGDKLNVEFDKSFDPITRKRFDSGLKLIDTTTGPDNAKTKVERIGESLSAVILGLTGSSEDGEIITGPLHGQTIADNIFISQSESDQPMVRGTLQLIADDIEGAANLGFVTVTMDEGTANGQLTAEFTAGDPGSTGDMGDDLEFDSRLSVSETFDVISRAATRLTAKEPVQLDSAYSGELTIEITEKGPGDATKSTVTVPFGINGTPQQPDNLLALVLGMNLAKTSDDTDADRIEIGESGGRLTIKLTDGVSRDVKVLGDANAASALAKLGFTQDESAYVAFPKLGGSADFDLPIDVDLDIGIDLPPVPNISFSVPDLTIGDFSDLSAINLDFGGLGDLADLKNLDFAAVISAMQTAVDYLRGIEGISELDFLNADLPLLNISLNEILNIGDVFADIVVDLQANPVSGLGQFEELLEDVSGVAENLSQDPLLNLPDFEVYFVPEFNQGRSWVVDGIPVDLADRAAYLNDPVPGFDDLESLLRSEFLQGDHPNVELSLDATTFDDPALKIKYTVDVGKRSGALGVGIGLDPLGVETPLAFDLESLGIAGASDLIDLRAEAMVNASALGQIDLVTGLDFATLQPFVYAETGGVDGTSLDLLVHANTGIEGINFNASIGPIGAVVAGGSLELKSPDDLPDPAIFTIGRGDAAGDGRHFPDELSELEFADLTLGAVGKASAHLPISFPGLEAISGLPSDISVTSDFALLVDGGFDPQDLSFSFGGDMDTNLHRVVDALSDPDDFNALALVGGWDGALDLLIEAMEGELFGIELPFVGDKLKEQANFLRDIKEGVSANFADNAVAGTESHHIRSDLIDALGPAGINLLKDRNGDGFLTDDDIGIITIDQPSNPGLGFEIVLGQDLLTLDLPIDFDLGVPNLGIDLDASVNASLGFELALSMGVDINHGFFINTNNSGLQVFIEAAIPGLAASGELGFLRVDANELALPAAALISEDDDLNSKLEIISVATGSPANFRVEFSQDAELPANGESVVFNADDRVLTFTINSNVTTAGRLVDFINNEAMVGGQPLSQHFSARLYSDGTNTSDGTGLVDDMQRAVGAANSLLGLFAVDFVDPGQGADNDGLLSLSEMLRSNGFSDIIDISATANANFDASLLASFGDAAGFPSMRTNIGVDWDFELGQDVPLPVVEFTDLELNLGEFFNGFAADIFAEVDEVIDPARPIVDALTARVPVLSDLAGSEVTFLDLMALQGGPVGDARRFVTAVADFISIYDSIPDIGPNSWINMGGAQFDPNTGDFQPTGTFAEVVGAVTSAAPADPLSGFDPANFLKSESDLNSPEMEDKLKLGFPILEPSNVFKLLGGEVVNLFTMDLPKLEFETTVSKYFPLPPLPIVGIELAGSLGTEIDLAFGFDTFGVNQYLASGDLEDVLNGFFVFDHENADGTGEDIDEVVFTGSVTAAAKLEAGFLSASVGGGIFANVDFNLHDNNEDGKIRLVELLDNTLLGTQDLFGPIHIFDVDGAVKAKLFATVEADLGLFTIDEEFNLAEVTLFSFELPRPEGEGVPLAEVNNTVLTLNTGPRAANRNFFFTEDVGEDYRILPGPTSGSVLVEAFGRSQLYENVSQIIGDTGLGNDRVEISDALTIPVSIMGGAGDDVLIGGSGPNTLLGGEGNDQITGGSNDDQLIGGAGNDKIFGGDGDDTIIGGEGNDELLGEDGDDYLRGDGGRDVLIGASGDDEMLGGDGDDVLLGEAGQDTAWGGSGRDQIEG